jgi:mannose-6-phosphate isomerase-like protein (cupin superfamily)
MLCKHAPDAAPMTARDGCSLSEIIHPRNDPTSAGISLARAWLEPGQATKPHVLDFVEIYYVLSGQGVMHLDEEEQTIGPEDCVYVPPGRVQWLENAGQGQRLLFLCVCHPAYDPEKDRPAPG